MNCDRYYELLSARLDRELTKEEAEELELHLVGCPQCRIVGEQMAEAQEAFAGLEEVPAPEGFAQGVMDRIRAEEAKPKVIPLWKRPQFRALAGLAACLVLAVGLYSAARPQTSEGAELMLRNTTQDVGKDETAQYGDLSMARCVPEDPGIAAYDGSFDVEAPQGKSVERFSDHAVLILERMPEGAEAFIPEEPGAVTVTYDPETGEEGYTWWTEDASGALDQIEQLAIKQGMSAERSSSPEEALYDLVILSAMNERRSPQL